MLNKMSTIQLIAALAAAVGARSMAAAQEPEYVAIKAGRVITVSDEEFSPGVIVIEDGKITAVGSGLEFPKTAKVIDVPRQTVMPGLIHARSRYGLADFSRSGVHGDQTASEEVYLDAIPFDELVEAGFTTVCFVPTGSDIPGMASAYHTAGDEEGRLLDEAAYLHVEASKKSVLRDALKKAKAEIEKVEKARKEWEEKQKKKAEEASKEKPEEQKDEPEGEGENGEGDKTSRGSDENGDDGDNGDNGGEKKPKSPNGNGEKKAEDDDTFKPPPIDPKYQPLVDLLQKKEEARFMVRLSGASDLLHLEDVLEPYDELDPTLYLATSVSTDYHYVLEKLKERGARIVIRPWIHTLPQSWVRYNLIDELNEAECDVSVVPRWESRIELMRLRAHVAELVRGGLAKEDAYKMLTLHPAGAIGLADKIGSIQKDRLADLVFFDGDPLDPLAKVQRVMIAGETVYDADEEK